MNKPTLNPNRLVIKPLVAALAAALGGAAAYAQSFTAGYTQLTNLSAAPVADGNVKSPDTGAAMARNSFFKNNHYAVPDGREVAAYYATWGIYGRDYKPHQVPVERLTTVYVAFGGICGDNPGAYNAGAGLKGACTNMYNNSEAAPYFLPGIQQLQTGEVSLVDDQWGFFDSPLTAADGSKYAQLEGMMKWKTRNPKLKVIWSIGGWSYSRPFFDVIATPASRAKFIDSVAKWLSQPSMQFVDGIDLDFEFPGGSGLDAGKGSPQDGANYLALVKELRAKLNALGTTAKRRYELTAAIGVGPDKLDNWAKSSRVGDMMPFLDRLGLMTYDFAGAWDTNVGFNAALGAPAGSKQINIKAVMAQLQTQHGITAAMMPKIALGTGFYGRSFGNVAQTAPANLPGAVSKDAGAGGTIETGVFSFFDLYSNYIGPAGKGINGWSVYRYPAYGGSLLYNPGKQQVISFTSPDDVADLVAYAKQKNMKGVFAWQVDDDNGILLEAIHKSYGHTATMMQPGKPVVYAPDCKAMAGLKLKQGLTFTAAGEVFTATGWPTKCPKEGEAWEQATWKSLGSAANFTVFGASAMSLAAAPAATTAPVATAPATTAPATTNTATTTTATTPSSTAAAATVSAWQSGKVYATPGTVVTHNGKTWSNQWWTQGEPGVDAAWVATAAAPSTSPATGTTGTTAVASTAVAPWQSGKVYATPGMVVTHNAKTWTNKWWTQGEPGVDAAWAQK